METSKTSEIKSNIEFLTELYNLYTNTSKDLLDIVQATEDNGWKPNIDTLTKCFICHNKSKKSRDKLVLNNTKLIDGNEKIKKIITSVDYCIDSLKNKRSLYLKSLVYESILIKIKN